MSDVTQFSIGADVSCKGEPCGTVVRVVIDPVARTVTHLVVEPKHRVGLGRLVPLKLVDAEPEAQSGLRLTCTLEEFEQLERAEETQFLPGTGYAGYGPGQALAWPYYGLAGGMGGIGAAGLYNGTQPVVYDRVPAGEVEIHRGDSVHASDGDIGRVAGLIVEPTENHVTHVLLDEGHLWGKKQVAIPIVAVTKVDRDGIALSLTKDQIRDLEPVEIDAPNR